jgi:DNA-binding transcriptional ArsR family regulator
MDPVNQWIRSMDGALEDLLVNGLVEAVREGNDITYRLSRKGKMEGKSEWIERPKQGYRHTGKHCC